MKCNGQSLVLFIIFIVQNVYKYMYFSKKKKKNFRRVTEMNVIQSILVLIALLTLTAGKVNRLHIINLFWQFVLFWFCAPTHNILLTFFRSRGGEICSGGRSGYPWTTSGDWFKSSLYILEEFWRHWRCLEQSLWQQDY